MKIILLLVLTSLCTVSFSATVKWSEIIKTGKRSPSPSVIGQDESQIYIVRYSSRTKLALSAYQTRNLVVKKTVPLKITYNGKKLYYGGGFMMKNQALITSSFYNKKDKVVYYFVHTVSKNLAIGKPVLIGSVPKSGGGISFSFSSIENISTVYNSAFLTISGDQKNAFAMFNDGSKENPSTNYKSTLLNNNLESIATSNTKMPYLPENFITVKEELGNDGRFYMLGYNIVEGEREGLFSKSREYRDKIWLYAIDTETGELEQAEVKIEQDLQQISLKVSDKGTIFVTGLTEGEGGGVNGSMCVVYDNELLELNRSFAPFEPNFVKTTYSEKQLKKQSKKERKASAKGKKVPTAKFYDYDIRHIVESEDGSVTVFAEQWYVIVTTRTTTDANGNTTTYTVNHYYYNDIIAINYDRDGQYQWKNVIEKRQYSRNDGGFYSSFFPIVDGNDIGLIFNTKEIENLDTDNLSIGEKRKAKRKTVCMNVTVGNDGSISKEELFSFDEDENLAIAPRYSSQTSSGDVVIFAKSRKGSKLGLIQL